MTPTAKNDKYIVVGKIGATYGILGWLKIRSYTELGANILNYAPWFLTNSLPDQKSDYSPIDVEDSKPHGKGLIVKFAGYSNPEDARHLTGKQIYIKREQLPEISEKDYYWSDLEGLTVINQDGTNLGKVIFIMETGSNDVLIVKGEREHAIPYLMGEVIKKIDLDQQQILVEWEEL